MFIKLGRWCFNHRKTTLGAWILLAVGLFTASGLVGSDFSGDPSPPDSARAGIDILDEHFGGAGSGPSGSIVFKAEQGIDDPEVRSAMERLFAIAETYDGIDVLSPYSLFGQQQVLREGPDAGKIAFARVEIAETVRFAKSAELGKELEDSRPEIDGLQVEIGGQALAGFEPPSSELIGVAFAVVVLILAFGSVLAMGLPIAVAIAGVSTGLAAAGLLSNVMLMPDFATTIGAMIGLGVGIDYALFIVTRFRENLHLGDTPVEASSAAMDTAGRAVVFAGVTVVASLLGLLMIGLEFIAGLGVSASVTVLFTMLASTTLLPALLGFAQLRVEVTRWRGLIAAGLVAVALLGVGLEFTPLTLAAPAALVVLLLSTFIRPLRREIRRRQPKPIEQSGWYRWSHLIQRRPWRFAIGGTLVLLALSYPVLDIRLGFSDEGNFPEETTTRKAYDLLSEGFGPGFNGPFVLVATVDGQTGLADFARIVEAVGADPGVARVTPAIPNDASAPSAALAQVTPLTSPQDVATEDLVRHLRNRVIPDAAAGTGVDAHLTGYTVISMDFSQFLGERSLMFFGVVLVVSFVLLMAVFRSLLVPIKAVIMNMLSIAAAYGVVVGVFQKGWLQDIVNIQPAPIEPFIPMMMFAIVFGLSMDYEVFLLSRIKEEYSRTDDAFGSVANGLAATARVISAAAAIMVVVFGSFLLEDGRVVKVFGTGLGLAVLLDATLVRMLLVPATMELLGRRNWWIPRWLDWLLPSLNVEGTPRHVQPTPVDLAIVAAEAGAPGTSAASATAGYSTDSALQTTSTREWNADWDDDWTTESESQTASVGVDWIEDAELELSGGASDPSRSVFADGPDSIDPPVRYDAAEDALPEDESSPTGYDDFEDDPVVETSAVDDWDAPDDWATPEETAEETSKDDGHISLDDLRRAVSAVADAVADAPRPVDVEPEADGWVEPEADGWVEPDVEVEPVVDPVVDVSASGSFEDQPVVTSWDDASASPDGFATDELAPEAEPEPEPEPMPASPVAAAPVVRRPSVDLTAAATQPWRVRLRSRD